MKNLPTRMLFLAWKISSSNLAVPLIARNKSHHRLLPGKFISSLRIFSNLIGLIIESVKINFYFSILFITIFSLVGCADDAAVNNNLAKISQDNLIFVTDASIKYKTTNKLIHNYLDRYFSPWQNPFIDFKPKEILSIEQQQINNFSQNPGWGENEQSHDRIWILKIAQKMYLRNYPNLKMRAIVTRNTELRVLPTQDPSFAAWNKPGKGYPFDNLQESVLNINTPIYVLHESRNGEWALVITPYKNFGWIKILDIAYMDNATAKKWLPKNYVAATFDEEPIFDQQLRFYSASRIGQLFPLHKTTTSYYQVIIPVRKENGYATSKIVNIRKAKASLWPIPISQKNIAKIANNMLGQPYGWGEFNGYRDCSATLEALFAPFAIWLPRNSGAQTMLGKFIDLSAYNNQQKLDIITDKGDPFLTLLWMPGHIMLYVGTKDGRIYAFHNFWGLHTKEFWAKDSGRAVIGKSAITPLDFGVQYFNVDGNFLERVQGMTILNQTLL